MADILYDTTGSFSTSTPKKIVSGNYDDSDTYNATVDSVSTTRYQAFTPSEAGTCNGVFICVNATSSGDADSITVELEKNDGGWSSVGSCTKTRLELLGVHVDDYVSGRRGFRLWRYFAFASGVAITAVADTWRLKVSGHTNMRLRKDSGGTYLYAIPITDTTSYSSGDNILIQDDIVLTLDQSVTAAELVLATNAELVWENPPADAYTLTVTDFRWSNDVEFVVGSAESPIPAAQRATIAITNWHIPPSVTEYAYWGLKLYGAKPTDYFGYVLTAASGQAVVAVDGDVSGWVNGDALRIWGHTVENKVVDSVSANEVTLTSNLSTTHGEGWFVLNGTKFQAEAGIYLQSAIDVNYSAPFNFEMSGVYNTGAILTQGYTNASVRTQPILIEDIYHNAAAHFSISFGTIRGAGQYYDNSVIKRVFAYFTSTGRIAFGFGYSIGLTVEDICFGTYAFGVSLTLTQAILTRIQSSGTWTGNYAGILGVLIGCSLTDCKTGGFGYGYNFSTLNATTLTTCTADGHAISAVGSFSGVDNEFNNCEFGQVAANTATAVLSNALGRAIFNNCLCDSSLVSGDSISTAYVGSFLKFHKLNQEEGNHISYWNYGKISSTGDGLTDTTVHTSGTGKFATRFEPLSSANNLAWQFDVPTGDIQNKTMFISVWCKINNAAYYAGTHQLPRITINYDDGTETYAQAAETTDWQLLVCSFTPATSYGQVTVTLSGRTDATATNAYIYFDDFSVAYPPNVSLDLGGMDLWANALPIVPPLAIPVSAKTVASAVWEELQAGHLTAGSMGKQVSDTKKGTDLIPPLLGK